MRIGGMSALPADNCPVVCSAVRTATSIAWHVRATATSLEPPTFGVHCSTLPVGSAGEVAPRSAWPHGAAAAPSRGGGCGRAGSAGAAEAHFGNDHDWHASDSAGEMSVGAGEQERVVEASREPGSDRLSQDMPLSSCAGDAPTWSGGGDADCSGGSCPAAAAAKAAAAMAPAAAKALAPSPAAAFADLADKAPARAASCACVAPVPRPAARRGDVVGLPLPPKGQAKAGCRPRATATAPPRAGVDAGDAGVGGVGAVCTGRRTS